jgi:hypothetical protein
MNTIANDEMMSKEMMGVLMNNKSGKMMMMHDGDNEMMGNPEMMKGMMADMMKNNPEMMKENHAKMMGMMRILK